MNGRIYDGRLGRFLQADPQIQEPNNSQSLNRYSYVINNPLSYTDPTGYSFLSKYWRQIVSIAFAAVGMPYMQFIFGNLTGAMLTGFISGGIASGSLQGAVLGAFTLGAAQYGLAVAAFSSGISSTIQGGKFGQGFASAGLGMVIGGGRGSGSTKVITAALVGGTISKVTGDKFANGAASAAFAAALTTDWSIAASKGSGTNSKPLLAKGKSRSLTVGEIEMINEEFGKGTIDTRTVEIHRKTAWRLQGKNTAMAPDGDIYFHPEGGLYMDDFSTGALKMKGLFIHEMTHVYQVQSTGETLWGWRGAFNTYKFKPSDITGSRKWESFNIEQQADIAKFHYWSKQGAYPSQWSNITLPTTSNYERLLPYIGN